MTIANIKEKIKLSLAAFANKPLADSALYLFETLGYKSSKRLHLKPNSPENFLTTFVGDNSFNKDSALFSDWRSIDFIFQLTDDEINAALTAPTPFASQGVYDGAAINSYLFFALDLNGSSYSRTALANIIRSINKLFPMPGLVLFRYGETITLAIINRRLHKKDASKDVLEKVTLIKDISIANPHRAHIEILCDLSFSRLCEQNPVSNFVELQNAWQKTLDTKELNKRFYRDIANWYFWAMQNIYFPGAGIEADKRGLFRENERVREHNAKNLIRLLTRILFVWFIKERGLIPEEFFSENYLKNHLLNDFDPSKTSDFSSKNQGSAYYRAVLQNLFFASLNQSVGKREFRKVNQHRNVTTLMRYENYFKDPILFLSMVEQTVPFMNGGLFDCLDKADPDQKGKRGGDIIIYEDSFSDRPDNELLVPDFIFFGKPARVDLTKEFGRDGKNAEFKGLINILESYKFTIAENTPIEEDIALDPELLGRVFENLLASYNPETKLTARNLTGSFYTPREIVDYMVDESLVNYFKSKLATGVSEFSEEAIRNLISYSKNPHTIHSSVAKQLIEAIDNCKILDPACGSGAFPMGVLHKFVHILHKLDPKNELWKQKQIEKAQIIDDPEIREQLIEDIETAFHDNELDYGRKLYLIENCIYGADIQPIATQISRLRFFISLIVDQKINKLKDNFGVRPLPNLETKFVAANTLRPIEKPKGLSNLFADKSICILEEELKSVRHRLFSAKTPATKRKLREEDKVLRSKMATMLVSKGWGNETARQLALWDPYDQNKSSAFFDLEWMFGLTAGFDIIIGNPPYIEFKKLPAVDKLYLKNYDSARGKYDIYVVFNERALQLLKQSGFLAYIQPTTFMKKDFGASLRKIIRENTRVVSVLDFGDIQVFEGATNYTGVFIFEKNSLPIESYSLNYHQYINTGIPISPCDFQKSLNETTSNEFKNFLLVDNSDLFGPEWNFQPKETKDIVDRITLNTLSLDQLSVAIFQGIASGKDEVFYVNEETIVKFSLERSILRKLLKGKDLKRYVIDWSGYYVIYPYDENSKVLSEDFLKQRFPCLYSYLKSSSELLSGRDYFEKSTKLWFELWNQRSYSNFEALRIVSPEISDKNNFVLTDLYFGNTKTYHIILKNNDKAFYYYMLGLLNSRLLDYVYKKIATPQAGGFFAYKTQFLTKLPIKLTDELVWFAVVARIIEQVLNTANDPVMVNWFNELMNGLVYELYLPIELSDAGIELLKYLQVNASAKSLMLNFGSKILLSDIQALYSELSVPSSPIGVALHKLKHISAINIIESQSKN